MSVFDPKGVGCHLGPERTPATTNLSLGLPPGMSPRILLLPVPANQSNISFQALMVAASLSVCGVAIGPCTALAQSAGEATGLPAPPPPEPGAAPMTTIPPELEPFQGRPIRAVIFKTAPRPKKAQPPAGRGGQGADPAKELPEAPPQQIDPETLDLIRNQLRLKAGAPFSAELVTQEMSRLNRLGRFERVESSVALQPDGSVDLIYTVTLQPVIRSVQTVGNKAYSDQELGKLIDILENTPVDSTRLDRACRRLEEKYREKGYYNVLVTVDEYELQENNIVLFKVREGDKTRITEVRFEGNVSFTPRELDTTVKTEEAWLFNFFDRGRIDSDQLSDDVAALVTFYRDNGYLDVRCDRVITPSRDGKEAIITFIIDEGPVYTLRNLSIVYGPAGTEEVFTQEQILGLMPLKQGGVYSEIGLRNSLEAIRDAYLRLGYVDASINKREQRDVNQPQVDLLLIIREGRPYTTGQVIVRGNTLTRDDVVRRLVTFQPDRPLDGTQIEESKTRLRNAQLFATGSAKVTLQPENVENPGYRDVLVEVDETNTGTFSIGGAVNSDSGLAAYVSMTQRNFDISDTPDTFGDFFNGDAFRGGGQTFNISASPGSEQQLYTLGLSDPYMFDSDYSGAGQAYYFSRYYSAYDETRIGTKFQLGRRYGSRWTARLPIRIEQVELSDIDADAPLEYFQWQEADVLFGVGLNLGRSSVDSVLRPSKGSKVEFGVEQVAGVASFTSVKGEYSVFAALAEDVLGRKTVLQLTTRASYILQDSDEVPFYEQYYMGGQSFRGFAYRGVSPVGPNANGDIIVGDPVGGTFSFFAGAELRHPIYDDVLAGVLFIDSGTVSDELGFDEYRVSVGFGVRIYFERLSPAPLAFDFGFPVVKEDTDETRLFTFSVDVPFR